MPWRPSKLCTQGFVSQNIRKLNFLTSSLANNHTLLFYPFSSNLRYQNERISFKSYEKINMIISTPQKKNLRDLQRSTGTVSCIGLQIKLTSVYCGTPPTAARGSTATLTMLRRNLSSIRGQTDKKLTSICFLQ